MASLSWPCFVPLMTRTPAVIVENGQSFLVSPSIVAVTILLWTEWWSVADPCLTGRHALHGWTITSSVRTFPGSADFQKRIYNKNHHDHQHHHRWCSFSGALPFPRHFTDHPWPGFVSRLYAADVQWVKIPPVPPSFLQHICDPESEEVPALSGSCFLTQLISIPSWCASQSSIFKDRTRVSNMSARRESHCRQSPDPSTSPIQYTFPIVSFVVTALSSVSCRSEVAYRF